MKKPLFALHLSVLTAACAATPPTRKLPWSERLATFLFPELPELERRIARLENEISRLPSPAAANSTGSTGFMTIGTQELRDHWVGLEFPEPVRVDQVLLLPTLLKGAEGDSKEPVPGVHRIHERMGLNGLSIFMGT